MCLVEGANTANVFLFLTANSADLNLPEGRCLPFYWPLGYSGLISYTEAKYSNANNQTFKSWTQKPSNSLQNTHRSYGARLSLLVPTFFLLEMLLGHFAHE